jgi:hypothetical protein
MGTSSSALKMAPVFQKFLDTHFDSLANSLGAATADKVANKMLEAGLSNLGSDTLRCYLSQCVVHGGLAGYIGKRGPGGGIIKLSASEVKAEKNHQRKLEKLSKGAKVIPIGTKSKATSRKEDILSRIQECHRRYSQELSQLHDEMARYEIARRLVAA